jgi:hypothetical protein
MSLKLLGLLVGSSFVFATSSFAGGSCSGGSADKDVDQNTRTPQSDVQKDSSRKPDSAAQNEDNAQTVQNVDQLVNRPPSWSRH